MSRMKPSPIEECPDPELRATVAVAGTPIGDKGWDPGKHVSVDR